MVLDVSIRIKISSMHKYPYTIFELSLDENGQIATRAWRNPLSKYMLRPTLKKLCFPFPDPVSPVWVGRSENYSF